MEKREGKVEKNEDKTNEEGRENEKMKLWDSTVV